MHFAPRASAMAGEPVAVVHYDHLASTGVKVDDVVAFYLHGTSAQRADFLRRLATAATTAADELVPRVEVEGVPGLAVGA